MIELRTATVEDREAILALASETWEGWDYVPLFLDEWIAAGGLMVAEMEGKVVGITKTTEITVGELWLEAIRVIPELRQKGIGKEIAKEQLRRAKLTNPRSIRLSTADVNTASLRIIAGMGFRQYAVFDFYNLVIQPEPAPVDERKVKCPNHEDEVAKAWEIVTGSEEYAASKGLYPHTWKFSQFTPALFRYLIGERLVYATEDVEGVLILPFNRYSPQDREIAFLDGNDDALAILGNYALSKLSFDAEDQRSSAFAAGDRKRRILKDLGLEQRQDLKKVYVFDYPLD